MTPEELQTLRDQLIRRLWVCFRDLSDHQGEQMTDEDCHLWERVTLHSAVQKRLDQIRKL